MVYLTLFLFHNTLSTTSSRPVLVKVFILTSFNSSALQIFLPLEVAISAQWIGMQLLSNSSNVIVSINNGHSSLVNFNLAVTSSTKKRAPGVSSNIINGAAALVPSTTITGPIIPPIVPDRPLVNGTHSALTDQDFVNSAFGLVKTMTPVCASSCEPLIPNFPVFKQDASISTLNATCQLVTASNLADYSNCASSKPDCNSPGISSGAILAKNFTVLFEDLCRRFIQPTPALNIKNRQFTFTFNNTKSINALNFKYSVTDQLNQTTYAGLDYTAFLTDNSRRDLIDVTPINYDGCGPVITHMKYDVCEGDLVGTNGCNGNVTAHLKFPEIDLTKIPGSGYDDVVCKGVPVKPPSVATSTLALDNGGEPVVPIATAPVPAQNTLGLSVGEATQPVVPATMPVVINTAPVVVATVDSSQGSGNQGTGDQGSGNQGTGNQGADNQGSGNQGSDSQAVVATQVQVQDVPVVIVPNQVPVITYQTVNATASQTVSASTITQIATAPAAANSTTTKSSSPKMFTVSVVVLFIFVSLV